MVSERARLQWDAYVEARGRDNGPFRASDELNRFLVGVHSRGEVMSPADLAALLDEAAVGGAERDELVAWIEWGLALLAAHTCQQETEDTAYEEVQEYGGVEL